MDSYQHDEEHARLLRNEVCSEILDDGDQDSVSRPNLRRNRKKNIILVSTLILLGYIMVAFSPLLGNRVANGSSENNNAGFVIPFLGKSKNCKESKTKSNLCRDFADQVYSTSGMAMYNPGGTLMIDDYTWAIKKTDDKVLFEYYLSSLKPRAGWNDTVYMQYGVLKLMDLDATYGPQQFCDFMFEGHILVDHDTDTEEWDTITGDLWGMSYDGKDWIMETPAADREGQYPISFTVTTTPVHKKKHCKHSVKKIISTFEDHDIQVSHDLKKIC